MWGLYCSYFDSFVTFLPSVCFGMVFLSSKFICNLAKVIFIPKNGNSFPRIFKRVYFWNFF
ncbi:hypothetical protein LEP1GSC048_2855 [Leptospira santarosai serovar Shermani str. 1342KT]|nr:hypothetical protein LEP1GSC048_2855 [Leptospira santarosai serovar Shermani str. 1342KT]